MAWLLAEGVLIGLGAAAPIGPVNVEIARRTLRGGFAAGVALGAGAVSVDVGYAALTSVGLGHLALPPLALRGLAAVSGCILSYLGGLCLRSAWRATTLGGDLDERLDGPRSVSQTEPGRPRPGAAEGRIACGRRGPADPSQQREMPAPGRGRPGSDPAARPSRRNGYLTGLAMTALNPLTLAFWFTALPALVGPIDRGRLPVVAVGVFVGTFSWVLAFTGTLAAAGRFRRGLWLRVVDAGGGITLIGFAAAAFLRSFWPYL